MQGFLVRSRALRLSIAGQVWWGRQRIAALPPGEQAVAWWHLSAAFSIFTPRARLNTISLFLSCTFASR